MSSLQRLNDHGIAAPGVGRSGASSSISFLSIIGGLAWGLALAVVGLWTLVGSSLPGFLGSMTGVQRVCVGLGMLCGGQLIFLMLVAARVFSGAPRGLVSRVHWGLCAVGGVCLLVVCLTMVQSGGAL